MLCYDLFSSARFQLVISPLSRALKTAELAFGLADDPHNTTGSGPSRIVLLPVAREKMWHSSDVGRDKHTLANDFNWICDENTAYLKDYWWDWTRDINDNKKNSDADLPFYLDNVTQQNSFMMC